MVPAMQFEEIHEGSNVDLGAAAPVGSSPGGRGLGGRVLSALAGAMVRSVTGGGAVALSGALRASVFRLAPSIKSHHLEDMMASMSSIAQRFYSREQSNEWGRRKMRERNGPGGGTGFPVGLMLANSEELRAAGSLAALARNRMAASAHRRVSRARVLSVTERARAVYEAGGVPGGARALAPITEARFKKDIRLLSEIAEEGVKVMVDPDFVPVRERGTIPQQYRDYGDAINAHHCANVDSEFSVMLSAEAIAAEEGINLMNVGFAPMYGKEKGRVTANCSGLSSGRAQRGNKPGLVPLNTDRVSMYGKIRYGEIHHPTIEDVAIMVDKAVRAYGASEVVLFKEDLRGFFQLVSFDPEGVRLMTFAYYSEDPEMVGAVLVSLAGNFGWAVMPFVMEVATRILRVVVQGEISGYSLQYCDDIMAAACRAVWLQDRELIKKVVEDLFGPGAYAADKSESSEDNPERRLDILGWAFILSTMRVDLAQKNRDKTFYAFITTDATLGLSLRKRQQLCSYAGRYSLVFVELGALNKMLYSMLGGQDEIIYPDARYQVVQRKALVALDIWKVYLIMSEHEHRRGAPVGRPLGVFLPGPPGGMVEFDGCLDGIGWRVYINGVVVLSGYRMVTEKFFPDGYTRSKGSQYQNSMELVAAVIGLLHLATLKLRDCTVQFRGDSMAVLHWLTDWKFKSTRAVFPTLLVIVLCERLNIRFVKEFEHIDSKANLVCDSLSRGRVELARRSGPCGRAGPEPGVPGGLLERAMGLISLNAELTERVFFERYALLGRLVDDAVNLPLGGGLV